MEALAAARYDELRAAHGAGFLNASVFKKEQARLAAWAAEGREGKPTLNAGKGKQKPPGRNGRSTADAPCRTLTMVTGLDSPFEVRFCLTSQRCFFFFQSLKFKILQYLDTVPC